MIARSLFPLHASLSSSISLPLKGFLITRACFIAFIFFIGFFGMYSSSCSHVKNDDKYLRSLSRVVAETPCREAMKNLISFALIATNGF
jgi:hypothetical protein